MQGDDDGVGQPVRRRERLEAPLVQPRQARLGADPQAAVPIAPQAAHGMRTEAGDDVDPLAVDAPQSLAAAGPDHAARTGDDGVDRVRSHAARCHRLESAAPQTVEPGIAADPDRAVGRREQGRDEAVRQAVGGGDQREGAAVEPHQPAAGRAEPQRAVGAFGDGLDALVRQAVGFEIAGEAAAGVAHEAAARRGPERTIAGLVQRDDVVVGDGRRVLPIEDRELVAVEADEAFLGADPDVAVARLEDRLDRVLRQALDGRPALLHQLRQ